nr:SH3 domain-containing protein [Sphingomonas sp.]
MIASHYAEPLARRLKAATELRVGPSAGSASLGRLAAGAPFDLLDDTLGWAWG